MLEFLTEENLEIHRQYIKQEKLKLSIFEKSIECIKNKNIKDIIRQKIKRKDKLDVLSLLSNIKLHEIFFASFGENKYQPSAAASLNFGSEGGFLNAVYRASMSINHGFTVVYLKDGKIAVEAMERELFKLFIPSEPILAVDLSEHSYFLDYGFDKERYLLSALPYLDLSKLNGT